VSGFPVRRAEDAHVGPLEIQANALVVLVGASGSGKSTWASRWFRRSEIVSSDHCRELVADDAADQSVNREAFRVFYEIIEQRLSLGRLTIADSTGLQAFSRARLGEIAARFGAPIHAVVFCAPLRELLNQNAARSRQVPEEVLARHARLIAEIVESHTLASEGYQGVHLMHPPTYARPVVVPPLSQERTAAYAPRRTSGHALG
jgi:predicted kinase